MTDPLPPSDDVDISQVILDPSVLVTDAALEWIDDPELRPYLVVSEALVWLVYYAADPLGELAQFGAEMTPDQLARLRELLSKVETFSGRSDDVPESVRRIRDNLLASGEPLAEVLADEWVFITTQSLGVFRALKSGVVRAFDAFRRAAGKVYEVGDEMMTRGLEVVRRKLPPRLLDAMKTVGRFGPRGELQRFLALGGSVALPLVPYVGLPAQVGLYVQQGVAIVAGDP